MSTYRRKITIVVLLAFLFSWGGGTAGALNDEVLEFGYSPNRERVALGNAFPPPNTGWYPVWDDNGVEKEVGESRSQPLILSGSRFGKSNPVLLFMAGNYLYGYEALPKEELEPGKIIPNKRLLFPPQPVPGGFGEGSRSHSTFFGEDGLVSGQKDGVIRLDKITESGLIPRRTFSIGSKIVSAPLVVTWIPPGTNQEELIIISGSDDGNVYLITNLSNSYENDYITSQKTKVNFPIGGDITGSPSPIYKDGQIIGFIIGNNYASGQGRVRGYLFKEILEYIPGENGMPGELAKREESKHNWEVITPAGVPASYSTEGPYTYFSDKEGNFYKINNTSGEILWKNSEYYHPTTRIYNSPALDSQYVYFNIRTHKGRGVTVKIDKETGVIARAHIHDAELWVSPVIWEKANTIIVGTGGPQNGGELIFLFRDNMERAFRDPKTDDPKIFHAWQCESVTERRGMEITAEISLAQELLVVGGKMANGQGGGMTVFHLNNAAPDWEVSDFDPGLPAGAEEAEKGETYVGSFLAKAHGDTTGKEIKLEVLQDGMQLDIFDATYGEWLGKWPTITLVTGEIREYTFAWTAPSPSQGRNGTKLEIEINPQRVYPEITYDNNYASKYIGVRYIDIEAVRIQQNNPVPVNTNQNAKAIFKNNGTKTVTFEAQYFVDGVKIKAEQLQAKAGEIKERYFTWHAPSVEKTVKLEIYAVPVEKEDDVTNNRAAVNIQVKKGSYFLTECENKTDINASWEEIYTWVEESCGSDPLDGCTYTTHEQRVTYYESLSSTIDITTKQGNLNGGRESRGAWAIVPYAQKKGADPNHITRAGYGIEVNVNTNYTNDWESKYPDEAGPKGGEFSGPSSVVAEFYDPSGNLVEAVNLERVSGSGGASYGTRDYWECKYNFSGLDPMLWDPETRLKQLELHCQENYMPTKSTISINTGYADPGTWVLPQKTYMFHDGSQVTERKHYIPVNTPDGEYTIRVLIDYAGKTGMSICKDSQIEIYGTMYDDFYTRPAGR